MDYYICTTPRHMLFAVMRGLSRPQQQTHVVFFSRNIEADRANWDPSVLPSHVHFHLIPWRQSKAELAKQPWGLLYRLSTYRDTPATEGQQQRFIRFLASYSPSLSEALLHDHDKSMVVFNERNPISRLFNKLVEQFDIIEDGEGNYIEFKLPAIKTLPRRLMGLPDNRVFGESHRCQRIFAVQPHRVPSIVQHKAVNIDFLNAEAHRTNLLGLFRINGALSHADNTIILLTQPMERWMPGNEGNKVKLYEILTEHLNAMGYHVILKIHPAEQPEEYQHLPCAGGMLPARIPMEAAILGCEDKPTLLSIKSSAGIGFEQYCERLKMVEADLDVALKAWGTDRQLWRTALEHTLKTGQPYHA
ncbi:polysialyltransferase family glycosyltransferase [Ferrimonas pelagia]|uniref:Uncharacterized protein n=1 Tax=Ferrimonas pelagia TaxID=1177826 RepID=A0ABP9FEP3_9GAMM